MNKNLQEAMRKIPSMDKLLAFPWVHEYEVIIGRELVKESITEILKSEKAAILKNPDIQFETEEVFEKIRTKLHSKSYPTLRPVINSTGVVIHTNLGRSVLAEDAIKSVAEIAGSYSTLEYSLEKGSRGHRNNHVEWLVCQLTGAEAALVVNNNAGAVILTLSALSKGKEAVVSRGELVEIGGSFRIPDIMSLSGTDMIEVGTTNRTHLRDYENAITENTKLLLKIHPSNYRIAGFSSSVPREDLSELAHKNGLIFMEDLGSGMLVDTSSIGLTEDPTVRNCLEAGVDLVTFSGDKLLGGPQLGVLVGKKEIIDQLRTYPLLRALRVDKMTLSAFEATMRLYLKGDINRIPTLSMVFETEENLKHKAQLLARRIRRLVNEKLSGKAAVVKVVETKDTVGGGTFPQSILKGYGVAITIPSVCSSGVLLQKLRGYSTPIIAGASDDMVVFHVRTLLGENEKVIVSALEEIIEKN